MILDCAKPFVSSRRLKASGEEPQISLTIREYGVIYFELRPVETGSDRGYDYARVIQSGSKC